MKPWLPVVLLGFTGPPALAAPRSGVEPLLELPFEQLMQYPVLTASRVAEPYFQTPAAISVISGDMIRAARPETLADLLVRLPGINVYQLSRWRTVVGVRNDTQLYISTLLLLIDGRPSYTPLLEGPWWEAIGVALEDIERIELVRGGGGSSWGMNSTSAVLNIITKRPQTGTGGTLTGALSQPRGGHGHALVNQADTTAGWRASAAHTDLDGYVAGAELHKDVGTVTGQIQLGDWRHELTAIGLQVTEQEHRFLGFTAPAGPLARSEFMSYSLHWRGERRADTGVLRARMGHLASHTDFGLLGIRGNNYTDGDAELTWEGQPSLGLDRYLLVGNCRRYLMDLGASLPFRYQPPDGRLQLCSVAATGFFSPHEQLQVQLGARGEYHRLIDRSSQVFAPSLHLGWSSADQRQFYYLGLLRSSQLPSYLQLAAYSLVGATPPPNPRPIYQRGQSDLKPRTVDELQLGARWQWQEQHLLEAHGFRTWYRNQINVDPQAPIIDTNEVRLPYRNLIAGTSQGVELSWQTHWPSRLRTRLDYSWFDKEPHIMAAGSYPPLNPQYAFRDKWNGQLFWQLTSATALDIAVIRYSAYMSESGISLFSPGRHIPSHWRLDLSLNHDFSPTLTGFASAKNLLNDEVEWAMPTGAQPIQAVEPSYRLGLEYRF